MKKTIFFILLIAILAASCNKTSSQTLSFSVLIQASPFTEISIPKQVASNLILIASSSEIVPPIPDFRFSQDMLKQLHNMDFEKNFAVLILVGQVPNEGAISEILRNSEKVTIKLKSYNIGPGNYIVTGYSLPYQLISVEKTGTWNKEIEFVLEDQTGNIFGRVNHYIP